MDGTFDARKGRLSVPAPLRAVLAEKGSLEMFGRRSDHGPYIEMWPKPVFKAMVEQATAGLNRFSAEYNDTVDALVAEVHPLTPDAEGRVVLPRDLIEHAGLGGEIAYVGRSDFFVICDRTRLQELRSQRRGGGAQATRGAAAA